MQRMRRLLLVLLPLWLFGCTQSIHVADPTSATHTFTQEKSWQSHFLLGFIGEKTLDLRDHCPAQKVTSVSLSHNVWTVMLWTVTFGIYTPQRVVITCETMSGAS